MGVDTHHLNDIGHLVGKLAFKKSSINMLIIYVVLHNKVLFSHLTIRVSDPTKFIYIQQKLLLGYV